MMLKYNKITKDGLFFMSSKIITEMQMKEGRDRHSRESGF
jgi:hypothetical protein